MEILKIIAFLPYFTMKHSTIMEKSTKLSVCDTCRTAPKTGKTERTDLGIFADQEGFLNGLKGNMHFNMGYPHYPQVYPQANCG